MSKELKMKWTAKDVFEFLKPSKVSIIGTIIIALLFIICWSMMLPGYGAILKVLPSEVSNANGGVLYGILATFLGGLIIITYTLISIINYLVTGGYKQ